MIFLIFQRKNNENEINYREKYFNHEKTPLKYIPKKIFQMVHDKNNISKEFNENIEYIKKLNPDWNYYLMDDKDIEEYIRKNYGEKILGYFKRINPKYGACKSDLARYLILYKEGGVYLDIKSATSFPLSLMILPEDEYILTYSCCAVQEDVLENNYGEFQQWHIITRPYHPFLKSVIENVLNNIDNYDIEINGVGKQSVLELTGPIAYTFSITPLLNKYKHRIVYSPHYIGLIYNNLSSSHKSLFSKTHYSEIDEAIIL